MGILSKIFGCNKLDLTDESQDVAHNQKQEQKNQRSNDDNDNKTISPFLMDDNDKKNE